MVLFKSHCQHRTDRKAVIYIPLWSYSNQANISDVHIVVVFTFHYGPIQILNLNSHSSVHFYLHSTMVLFKSVAVQLLSCVPLRFTFHYGPIQMAAGQDRGASVRYLHSTMVLFKLKTTCTF